MVDLENISNRLDKLHEYIEYLKHYQKKPFAELQEDYTLQGAVQHYLQLSIESLMDIGELIISSLRLQKPDTGAGIFEILAQKGIITRPLAENLRQAAGFRNILVHDYIKINLALVYQHLQNDVKDLDQFARTIAEYIKMQGDSTQ